MINNQRALKSILSNDQMHSIQNAKLDQYPSYALGCSSPIPLPCSTCLFVCTGPGGVRFDYNSNAGVLATLPQDLRLPSLLPGHSHQVTLPSAGCCPALLHHLRHSQYPSIHSYFFLPSHLKVNSTQPLTYVYTYHITIKTNTGLYTYTNLYQAASTRPPIITQTDSSSALQFNLKWPTSPDQTVLSTQINLFFSFVLNGVTHFGSAFASAKGYSLAEVSISGPLSIVKGTGSNTITSNSLALLGYDPVAFFNAATLSKAYLNYDNTVSSINLPSDLLQVRLSLNYGSFLATQETPSILGQVIWSWVQYFPIFLSIYWVLDAMFSFLSRQQILKRKILHDTDYLSLVEEQNQRRERLRLS